MLAVLFRAAGGLSPWPAGAISTPARPETFRMHQSAVSGEGLRWVGASGVRGLSSLTVPLGTSAAEAEKALILRTLEHVGQNKAEAARRLGLDVKTIRNKLKTYGVHA
jgi:DNA-binding NtrC family response regulator